MGLAEVLSKPLMQIGEDENLAEDFDILPRGFEAVVGCRTFLMFMGILVMVRKERLIGLAGGSLPRRHSKEPQYVILATTTCFSKQT